MNGHQTGSSSRTSSSSNPKHGGAGMESRRNQTAKKVWSKVATTRGGRRKRSFSCWGAFEYMERKRRKKQKKDSTHTHCGCALIFSDCSTAALQRKSISRFYLIPVPCTIVHRDLETIIAVTTLAVAHPHPPIKLMAKQRSSGSTSNVLHVKKVSWI